MLIRSVLKNESTENFETEPHPRATLPGSASATVKKKGISTRKFADSYIFSKFVRMNKPIQLSSGNNRNRELVFVSFERDVSWDVALKRMSHGEEVQSYKNGISGNRLWMDWLNRLHFTGCDLLMSGICRNRLMIYGTYRNYWDTRADAPRNLHIGKQEELKIHQESDG